MTIHETYQSVVSTVEFTTDMAFQGNLNNLVN